MPHKRIMTVHGLCPHCRGEHDRLLPVGVGPRGHRCAREYLTCDTCGTAWLSPSPRPVVLDLPGPRETAESLMELSRLQEVTPVFEPVEVWTP